jgi:dTDP-4-amino-4,6-dideoxygalactose transaminase
MKPPRLSIWPPLPFDVYGRQRAGALPFPLEEPNYRLFSRARHGLWNGVNALGLRARDAILVPAYHHGSEIEALEHAGLRCRFYELGETLEPDEQELSSLLDPDVRALYLIHYFGIPQRVDHWRSWCDGKKIILIEDAAMAFLTSWQGRPVGSFGELAIFCLYKAFGLPDGGALISAVPVTAPKSGRRLGALNVAFRHGSWLAQRDRFLAGIHSFLSQNREPVPGSDFDLGDPDSRPSMATTYLIPQLIHAEAAQRRRRNYLSLVEELGDLVRPLFETIPEGSSPVALPIVIEARQQAVLHVWLRKFGITAANFWQVPHPSLPEQRFRRSRSLRSNLVGLPVHQELPEEALERIVRAIRTFHHGRKSSN